MTQDKGAHMARGLAMVVAALIVLSGSPAHALTLTWQWNYIEAAKADGGGTLPVNSGLMDQVQYKGETVTVFDNATGLGTFIGDTFQGYTAFRLTQASLGPNDLVPSPDGTSTWNIDHSITGFMYYSGTQLDAQNFTIASASLKLFFDGPGGGHTQPSFANLNTFKDGIVVETGLGAGSGSNSANGIDGNSNLRFLLTDLLSTMSVCGPNGDQQCGSFEIYANQGVDPNSVFAFTDNNNEICSATLCFATPATLVAAGNLVFGKSLNLDTLAFHSQNDGSVIKVSNPAALLLIGFGGALLGLRRLAGGRRKA